MKNIVNYPPSWCPDAVPSDKGWRHPKTGELLVAVRGGVKPLEKKSEELLTEVPSTETIIPEEVEEAIIDETVQGKDIIVDEQPQEVIEEKVVVTKKRRGKNV